MRALLRDANARRAPVLARRTLSAWRVLNGAGDGGPAGLTVDRYGPWLVVAGRASIGEAAIRAWADAAFEALGGDGVVVKVLRRSVAESSSAVLRGELPRAPIEVREDDAVFLCDLDDGISTGLFLDHHDTRALVRGYAAGVEVLNVFAYTCAFSVHAALAGAKRVTSVDVSKRALERGRANMKASGVDADRHRWFADDVIGFLARQSRRASSASASASGSGSGPGPYGLVIADPPVFGRARGKTFSLERSLEAVIGGCIDCLAPGGVLVFSTHAVAIDEVRLEEVAERCARAAGRRLSVLHRLGLPEWDHPAPEDASHAAGDRGEYLKTLVLRVG